MASTHLFQGLGPASLLPGWWDAAPSQWGLCSGASPLPVPYSSTCSRLRLGRAGPPLGTQQAWVSAVQAWGGRGSSPLQEHGLQQEALGGRAGRALGAHVLLHVASQVLRTGSGRDSSMPATGLLTLILPPQSLRRPEVTEGLICDRDHQVATCNQGLGHEVTPQSGHVHARPVTGISDVFG